MAELNNKSTRKLVSLVLLCFAITVADIGAGNELAKGNSVLARSSVVKIHVTIQREDHALPWQGGRLASGTGTGFIISGRRILTNAHVVSDARFIQLQKDGDSRRYRARVKFSGHDCDLATLEVDDPSFFDGTIALPFSDALPKLNDTVTVVGYPTGGTRLSVTEGIVSRIDYNVYTHSGVDQHLVLQVDAAINPGNSGGPILFGGKVVALAFQGLFRADNIGYGIPMPVIRHFLTDIADGTYNGYPELGVSFMDTRNEALRTDLGMTETMTGVVVWYVDVFGSAEGILKSRDVLMSIDDHSIANDGTIDFDGNTVIFAELLERKQWGQSIVFDVLRDHDQIKVQVPLKNPYDPFIYRNTYDERPEYFILGGLVFSPLSSEYLRTLRKHESGTNSQRLRYYSRYAKIDALVGERSEFVVLTKRLPHSVNTYAERYVNGIVKSVNGMAINKLKDLTDAFNRPEDGFHLIRFEGSQDFLVLAADEVTSASSSILAEYGISQSLHFRDTE